MKNIIILLLTITSLYSSCKIVESTENTFNYIFDVKCNYRMGESESKVDAKEKIIQDAKLEVINKVGSIVHSKIESTKNNIEKYGIVEHKTEIITPALTTIEIKNSSVSGSENHLMYDMSVIINVDKGYITDYTNRLNTDVKILDNLNSSVDNLPNDEIARWAIIKEKYKKTKEEANQRVVGYEKKMSDNIINAVYMNNLQVERELITTNTWTDNRLAPPKAGVYEIGYTSFLVPVESIYAKVKTTITIDEKSASKMRETYSSFSTALIAKIGELPISDPKFKRSINCNSSSGGLGIDIDVMLEFEGSGKKEVVTVPMKSCVEFEVVEDIRDIKVFKTVKVIGFEKHKTPEEIKAREAKRVLSEEKAKAKQYEDTIFIQRVRGAASMLWNNTESVFVEGCEARISLSVNFMGKVEPTVLSVCDNDEFVERVNKFAKDLSKSGSFPRYYDKDEPFITTMLFKDVKEPPKSKGGLKLGK